MDSTLIDAPSGKYRGVVSREHGTNSWFGIQYAKFQGRWRYASELEPASGIIDATKYGTICPQPESAVVVLEPGLTAAEDCLNLNITRPARLSTTTNSANGISKQIPDAADKPLPVMVWVHGGAYVFGAANQPVYQADNLANFQNVIVVSLNFRLGAYGFLNLSSLNPDFAANPGLHDVILALKWLKTNIAAFGGDPENITIFGESAGAGIITTLLATPAAAGLFHSAISESSPASSLYGPEHSNKIAAEFLRITKEQSQAPQSHPETDTEHLKSLSTQELNTAALKLFDSIGSKYPGIIAFAPSIDGELVPENPVVALAAGRGHPVPLIIGTNRNEASMFTHMKSPLVPVSEEASNAMLEALRSENPTMPAAMSKNYQGKTGRTRLATDIAFRMPALWIAAGHSTIAPTFLYRFDQVSPLLRLSRLGAIHAAELPLIWANGLDHRDDFTYRFGGLARARKLSRIMQKLWGNLAHGELFQSKEFNGPGASFGWAPQKYDEESWNAAENYWLSASVTTVWPNYQAATPKCMIFNTRPKISSTIDNELLKFWGAVPIVFK